MHNRWVFEGQKQVTSTRSRGLGFPRAEAEKYLALSLPERIHDATTLPGAFRGFTPKNTGPFHLVPVMRVATLDMEAKCSPS